MAQSAKEAVFDLVYPSYYDGNDDFDGYESKEDAIDDLVEEMSYSHYGMSTFECDGGEYSVAEDYAEAVEAARESVQDLFDDIGIDGFNLGDISNYVDSDWFYDAEKEMHESYCEDIQNETSSDDSIYASRLHEELCDYGVMSPFELPEEPEDGSDEEIEAWETECDDIITKYADEAIDNIYKLVDEMMSDDSIQYYIDNFGEADFNQLVKDRDLADKYAIAEYVVDMDGPGHILAGYDGDMHEDGDYCIFRTN